MTVGLPGTGIGGMFYLLSALAMPFREARRRARGEGRRTPGGWRVVAGQVAIAGGIVAGLWATGWFLGAVLAAARPVIPLVGRGHAGNVLRIATFVLTFGTLAGVLAGVELLRLWLVPRPASAPRRQRALPPRRRRVVAAAVCLACVGVAADPRPAAGQRPMQVAPLPRLARADSALSAGNAVAAARDYAAVIATDPRNSHAVYRLAQLRRNDPAEALRLFRRYVDLEPSDPWGYMAVGDVLGTAGRYRDALRWYDAALRLAPDQRDAVVGRARLLARAGRTDAAITAYEGWLALHPSDASSWGDLARQELRAGRPGSAARALERAQGLAPDAGLALRLAQARAAAAPAVIPLSGGSWDSDGNSTLRFGGGTDVAVHGPTRLGVQATRQTVRDSITRRLDQLELQVASQPRAVLKLDAGAGATLRDAVAQPRSFPPSGPSRSPSPGPIVTGHVRARWRAPGGGPAIDVRARRWLLDATPTLVEHGVVRTELGGTVELPVSGGLRVRGIGRTATLSDSAEANHRTMLGGVVAYAASPAVEVSGQIHEIRYAHATTAGYFAPRLGQLVEVGTYVELDTPGSGGGFVAADVGLGVQRLAEQGAAMGPWRRAFNLYSQIDWPVAPGRDLRLELDFEDSLASEAVVAGPWRYVAATLSLRWALP